MNEAIKNKIYTLFIETLNIPTEQIMIHRLGGLTNFNYKVEADSQTYVVRLPGNGTENLINRTDEYLATKLTNEIGIDAENIYFNSETGIKVSKYIMDASTMNENTIKEKDNIRDISRLMAKLHSCNKSIPVNFDVFDKIVEYEYLLKNEGEDIFWSDYKEIRSKIFELKSLYKSYGVNKVICHNDPLCENFIKGSDRMYLVDWEYAGMNDPMWDLADIFIEGNFTVAEESMFKSYYFNRESTEIEEIRILMNKIFLDFLWSLWGKQRYASGEDLLDYANMRYNRAKSNLFQLTSDTLVS